MSRNVFYGHVFDEIEANSKCEMRWETSKVGDEQRAKTCKIMCRKANRKSNLSGFTSRLLILDPCRFSIQLGKSKNIS